MTKRQKEMVLNSEVLKALRESAGYNIEDIAKKLRITADKIMLVEEGKASFTLAQIKKLADIYKRPLVAFFSSSIPKLPEPPDYRINRERSLTPYVYLAQRRAYYLSEKIRELSGKMTQFPTLPRKLKAEELAREFRETLNINLIKYSESDKILEYYKRILEETLTVLIIEYPLRSNDVRALSIYSELSSIVLNEDDKPSIKLFSLFHEICHLFKATGGICSLDLELLAQNEESYCNNFAAEFLVPSGDLKMEVKKYKILDEEAIDQLTKAYGVSKQVIMIRLLQNGYIQKETYEEFKKRIEEGMKKEKS
ncbi:ImmA/IrrE family metallo-endopeptidase, partial [bacterium]|nr:ImmA/IrrE family metallo-endopeptidase [bacterium]